MTMSVELPALERTEVVAPPQSTARLRRYARPALGLLLPLGLAAFWEIWVGLGYSNGANFAAALMLLNPGLIARAILLRPMLVLESPPTPDLSNTRILTIAGGSDPYGGYAPELNEHLRRCGAGVAAETIAAGHGLDRQDIVLARAWHEMPY